MISAPRAANRPQVQDTLDPEYYLGAARLPDGSWATSKFSDAALAAPPPAEEDMKVNLMNIQGLGQGLRLEIPGNGSWAAQQVQRRGARGAAPRRGGHEGVCWTSGQEFRVQGFKASCLPALKLADVPHAHIIPIPHDGNLSR